MLKIQIWMRGTMEYSQDTIPGPTPDQTQEQFEEAFRVALLKKHLQPKELLR